jgi:hypothetical protein
MSKLRHARRLGADILHLARQHKAYWLIPLLLVLALTIALLVVGQSAAPFVYTLF